LQFFILIFFLQTIPSASNIVPLKTVQGNKLNCKIDKTTFLLDWLKSLKYVWKVLFENLKRRKILWFQVKRQIWLVNLPSSDNLGLKRQKAIKLHYAMLTCLALFQFLYIFFFLSKNNKNKLLLDRK
jgi:hypothetical protein